jgi:hypothetical protein
MLGMRYVLLALLVLFGVVTSAPTPAYTILDQWKNQEYKNKLAREEAARAANNPKPQQP